MVRLVDRQLALAAACTGRAVGAVGGAVPGAAYHAGAGSKGEPG